MSSSEASGNHLQNETTKVDPFDIEKSAGLQGGAGLSRQISVQLTHEQFERLYLQPGGVAAKGDAAKRYGNPTLLGVASFLLCLTPFSCELMGWHASTTNGAVVTVPVYYFIGGLGLTLSGLGEFFIGNTFPSVVFITFGGFWFAFGGILDPTKDIASALGGATTSDYNNGLAIYLLWWAILTLLYLIASLRTNVVFVLLFIFLEVTFDVLIATYFRLANGNVANLSSYLKAAGAFGFLTCAMGWYLLLVLIMGSTGIPFSLPIGDLSEFMTPKRRDT